MVKGFDYSRRRHTLCQAHDTDDPSCRDLDRCPHCGYDGDEQRLLRFRLRCCR